GPARARLRGERRARGDARAGLRRGGAVRLRALLLVLAVAASARADGTALVLDASASARRAGAERAEAALVKWLDVAPDDGGAFGRGDGAESHRASARAAFPHEWGGTSDLIEPVERAASWLAAVPGERRLVIVSDLELDVVGEEDARSAYLEGVAA